MQPHSYWHVLLKLLSLSVIMIGNQLCQGGNHISDKVPLFLTTNDMTLPLSMNGNNYHK